MPVVLLGILFILSLIFSRSCDIDIFISILQIQNQRLKKGKKKLPQSSSAGNLDLNLKSLSHSFWIFINYLVRILVFENPDWEEFDVGNTIRALKKKSYF